MRSAAIVAQAMETFGIRFFFFNLSPGFFCFRSEEETFFMGIFTRCLTHMSDRPVPKVG